MTFRKKLREILETGDNVEQRIIDLVREIVGEEEKELNEFTHTQDWEQAQKQGSNLRRTEILRRLEAK